MAKEKPSDSKVLCKHVEVTPESYFCDRFRSEAWLVCKCEKCRTTVLLMGDTWLFIEAT